MTTTTRLPPEVHRCVRQAKDELREAGITQESVLLGVSGGGDSMALLEILGLLAPELGLTLHVACIDHALRPESVGEVALVEAAAARRGAAFATARIDPGRGDEDSLRKGRHAALEAIAAERGCRWILLAHTADDQIETIVFRFLRGAGFGGLAGMRVLRPPYARPLLGLRREQLRRLLTTLGVAWAEDPSNLSSRTARGRLRTEVLPVLAKNFGPGSLDHLLETSIRWRADEDLLERETTRVLAYASRRGVNSSVDLAMSALEDVHPATLARLLRAWLTRGLGAAPDLRHIAEIERWLAGGAEGGLDLPGCRLRVEGGRLRLEAATITALNESGGGDKGGRG